MKSIRTDLALGAMRVMTGVVFTFHGAQKLFGAFGGPGLEGFSGFLESLGVPFPGLNAALAGGAEFFGGLVLIAGFKQGWAAIPLVFTMLVASFTAHSGFSAQSGGMEYSLTLAVITFGLGLLGPGRWSVDGLLSKDRGPARGESESLSARREEVAA